MKANADPRLQKLLDIIVPLAKPEKVILFGSRAKQSEESGSDYDLAVIKDGLENERQLGRQLYRAFYDQGVDYPVDLVVADKSRFMMAADDKYSVFYDISHDGIVVYE